VLATLSDCRVEIVIVDEGSTDDTSHIATSVYGSLGNVKVRRMDVNRGKGAAVRVGLAVATGAKVIVCDADMAISPTHVPAMLDALDRAPIAIGTRARDRAIRYGNPVRTLAGSLFNRVARRVIGSDIRDTQCGFKGFRLGAGRLIANCGHVPGFAYDVEVLYLAARLGLAVEQVPVTWVDVKGSSVRVGRDSWSMLRDIRSLGREPHECLTVRTAANVDLVTLHDAAMASRQGGLVAALDVDALIALPRGAALAGATIAGAVQGNLALVALDQLAGRALVAV
jgi:hypothetical protein